MSTPSSSFNVRITRSVGCDPLSLTKQIVQWFSTWCLPSSITPILVLVVHFKHLRTFFKKLISPSVIHGLRNLIPITNLTDFPTLYPFKYYLKLLLAFPFPFQFSASLSEAFILPYFYPSLNGQFASSVTKSSRSFASFFNCTLYQLLTFFVLIFLFSFFNWSHFLCFRR